MPDEIKSNLEVIDEKDLDLERKFISPAEAGKPEQEKITSPEEEKAKEVSVAEKDSVYQSMLSKIKSTAAASSDDETVKADAKSVYGAIDAESQISNLVDLALSKGVVHAVKVAEHLHNNYVMDKFHDKLITEELHNTLKEKGMINPE